MLLEEAIRDFLKIQESKSRKTYRKYETGFGPLLAYVEGYFGECEEESTFELVDFDTGIVDYVLSYFVIRKYFATLKFKLDTAGTMKTFAKYLIDEGLIVKSVGKEIQDLSSHYAKQYPRIEKLESSLWNHSEGETNLIMKMSLDKQKEEIAKLQEKHRDSVIKEAGYVSVEKIDNQYLYGSVLGGGDQVGPVKIDAVSAELVRVGDIINMINVRQGKGADFWEIIEIGYVYPQPYLETIV